MFEVAAEFQDRGFYQARNVATADEFARLKLALKQGEIARAERSGQTYGARNLLHLPDVQAITTGPSVMVHLRALLGPDFQAVRAIFFDKTEGANWPVLWHQDLSLAIRERHEVPGWVNWTVKRGVPHVQPPQEVLSRMVTMRLHLDDCPADNGPLRIVPRSHCFGILGREEIKAETQKPEEVIVANAGDALFMRPLILHASSSARAPSHRRILHLEFAPPDLLPNGLTWANAQ